MKFNRCILGGRLTRDPETRFANSGTAIVSVGIAVERSYQREGQEKETDFFDLTIFGKRGEAFARFHSKGDVAFVEGRLRMESWTDKNTGQKRSKVGVVVDDWQFTGSKRDGQSQRETAPASVLDGDVTNTPF